MGRKIVRVCLYAFLALSSFFMLTPFFWMVLSSFKTLGDLLTLPPQIFPARWAFETYIYMWESAPWSLYFFNTAKVTIITIIGQIIVCSMGAFAFARLNFKGRDIIFLIYLSTMMIPFQAIMIPQFVIISNIGWYNSHNALIIPGIFGIFSVFGTFLLRQFFLTIPKDLEDAAKIDGCSYPRIFYEIFFKNSKPAIMTLIIFTFMTSWNDFLRPLIFLSKSEFWTLTMGVARFQGRFATQWNQLMAGSLITMIPILILFIFAQRYFIEGIVASGMKE
jgi:multiple sugar transport system permease protein